MDALEFSKKKKKHKKQKHTKNKNKKQIPLQLIIPKEFFFSQFKLIFFHGNEKEKKKKIDQTINI